MQVVDRHNAGLSGSHSPGARLAPSGCQTPLYGCLKPITGRSRSAEHDVPIG